MAIHVLDALEKLNISVDSTKSSVRIPCPACAINERDKVLSVSLEKNMFHCNRCDASGSGIHLYGLFLGHSKGQIDADENLKKKLYSEFSKGGTTYVPPRTQQPTIDLKPAPLKERDKTLRCLIKRLELSIPHYNNLIARGLREVDITSNQYVSVPMTAVHKLPTELRMNDLCDLAGVAGFYKRGEKWQLLKTSSGIYIPVRDVPENPSLNRFGPIQGIQIRYDTVPENSTRYKWLSTKDMPSGCGAETYAHFVGYPAYEINLTEGPLKADVIYRFTKETTVAIPGVNSTSHLMPMLQKLWQMGVRKINMCFDMDYKINPNVQEHYVKLLRALAGFGFIIERLVWDDNYKGYDDYLLHLFLEKGGKLDAFKSLEPEAPKQEEGEQGKSDTHEQKEEMGPV